MTNPNLTSINILIDASGSMAGLQKDTIGGFNTFLAEQKALPGDATLSVAMFSDDYSIVYDNLPIKEVPELTTATYRPSGSTALLDAFGRTIDRMGKRFAALPEEQRPGKVLLLVMTDGEDNCSTDYKHTKIK